MSNEIFKWMPHMLDYDVETEWDTIITGFSNGTEHRRNRRGREVGYWKFNYMAAVICGYTKNKLQDDILSFFNSRKGAYDNFWLPSWELEFKTTGSANAKTELWFTQDPELLGFTTTAGDQGNYLYVCNRYCTTFDPDFSISHEVKRISAITKFDADNWYITIVGTLTNDYSNGARVQKAYKVRFVNDKLKRGFKCPWVWEEDLQFKEDVASMYTELGDL